MRNPRGEYGSGGECVDNAARSARAADFVNGTIQLFDRANADPAEAAKLIGAIGQRDPKLGESDRRFRALLEALPAAIYTTDAKGRITFYNQAAVELSGRRPQLGSDEWCVTWRLYRPDGTPLPHDECPMAVALKEDRPVRGCEAVAERPDGTRVPFLPYPTPLHDAAGKLIGAVNMLVDISERKEAETQQRLLFTELNHRIKNNMQTLESLLRVAQRETRSEEARAALGDAIHRIGAIGAAQTVLYRANNAVAYNAKEFIASVCASAELAFGGGISIHHESEAGDLPNDTAVPLSLILNELLTNAVKHGVNGRGTGAIKVGLTRDAETYLLYVEDDGPGFEFEEASRRSSGLGLVQGLARQVGGTFAVERVPGARCTVRFRDPRHAC